MQCGNVEETDRSVEMAKQYVDLNGITVYDEEIKAYIAEHGGGGSSTLADLTDTSIATPATGQALVYSSIGKWTNVNLDRVRMNNNSDIRFGVDSNGKYGYIKPGESTVTPFVSYSEVVNPSGGTTVTIGG